MEESSQQSMMDTETQEMITESQMSVDQDFQESQSQMEMSQQPSAEDTQHDGEGTAPKQPRIHLDKTPATAAPPTEPAIEPDKGSCQNGLERSEEEFKEEAEQFAPQQEEEEMEKDEELKSDENMEDMYRLPPTSLEGFKYYFNEDGRLRHIETGDPFKFDVKKDDMCYNQWHYEALGDVVTQHIYGLLETETNLKKVYLGDPEDEPRSFVFMSENAETTTDKLLILIHGSGAVRAGQWARRLIINDCLDSGTQIPYIKRAKEEGYEVLVMNPNYNYETTSDGHRVPIKGSSSPMEHALHVWDKYVADTPATHVAIVAHSYGGVVTVQLADRRESFLRKVFAVAFTDSVHGFYHDDQLHKWFVGHAVNWVSSREPLGTVIDDSGRDCCRVSAGTIRHEETSWYSIESIFEFLKSKEEALMKLREEEASEPEAVEADGERPEARQDGEKEEDTKEKTQAQEIGVQETGTQETQAQEMGAQEIGAQEMQAQETGAQETGAQETVAQEIQAQETGAQEMGAQEMGAQETVAQEMQAQEMQAQEMQARETQALETQAQEMQAQEMQAQETAAQEMQAEETQAQETEIGGRETEL